MPYIKNKLPEYPVVEDMWDRIAAESRPIAIYGMGNGADKLFERLEKYGKRPDAVFASDGFVRGHSFRGYKVVSLSDVIGTYGDFIILLSFASGRGDVIEMIRDLNGRFDMYVPDMPVAGDAYFDKDFYNANYQQISMAYESLADEESRSAFASILNYKLTGRIKYLFDCYSDTADMYSLLRENVETAVDAGAYNGDTVRELIQYRPGVKKIYAIEPDSRNYKKLLKYVNEGNPDCSVNPINAAAYSENSEGSFSGSGNRNSSISSTVSHERREENISLVRIDGISGESVDYIKYDVEGAELEALIGSSEAIEKYQPDLLISVYHRSEDIFKIVNYTSQNYPFYSLYIRRTLCFPAWEIALIAVADNQK